MSEIEGVFFIGNLLSRGENLIIKTLRWPFHVLSRFRSVVGGREIKLRENIAHVRSCKQNSHMLRQGQGTPDKFH